MAVVVALPLVLATGAGPASAAPVPVPALDWSACGGAAASVQCAAAVLPLDYDEPAGEQVSIAVAKSPATDPARRVGSLFLNFGGPGAPSVEVLAELGPDLFPVLNERFDVIAFDPRGVGLSEPAVDCQVPAQEGAGEPFPTPSEVDAAALVAGATAYADLCGGTNGELLKHLSTANVARDLDALRAAVGDDRLTYLGFSYGTLLGATYATLFPDRQRALVLDGGIDAAQFLGDPAEASTEQSVAFEVALARFAQACAADQVACSGFGGADPYLALDRLLARADAQPVPAAGYLPDPRPVTRDELLAVVALAMYEKQSWGYLGLALAGADAGDASLARQLFDEVVAPTDPDGSPDPSADQTNAIVAVDGAWPSDVDDYLGRGALEWLVAPHFTGAYGLLALGLWPVEDDDAFRGPFTSVGAEVPTLVVGTTYDPATPYRWSVRLAEQLGQARLLTMEGDGHTAYGRSNSACVDAAVEAYLVDLVVPASGATCTQEVPFTAPEPLS